MHLPTDLPENLQIALRRIPVVEMAAEVPVNAWAIRSWCDAMGVTDPLYRDPAVAAATGHAGIVAPAPMLQIWTVLEASEHNRSVNAMVRSAMIAAGYPSIVATNYELRAYGYAKLGDILTTRMQLDSLSTLKKTPLGDGFFATERHAWTNQDGTTLGDLLLRVFLFRAPDAASPPRVPATAMTVVPAADTREALPVVAVPITTTLIVKGALASGDFTMEHHDRDLARKNGMKDIYMNIATSMGLVFRYVTDWAPRGSTLQSLSLRLGVPCYPYDTLSLQGWVDHSASPREINLDISGTNSLGEHVRSHVNLVRPDSP